MAWYFIGPVDHRPIIFRSRLLRWLFPRQPDGLLAIGLSDLQYGRKSFSPYGTNIRVLSWASSTGQIEWHSSRKRISRSISNTAAPIYGHSTEPTASSAIVCASSNQVPAQGLLADDATHAFLCGLSIHVTTDTVPNMHSDDGRPGVGGFVQTIGRKLALDRR